MCPYVNTLYYLTQCQKTFSCHNTNGFCMCDTYLSLVPTTTTVLARCSCTSKILSSIKTSLNIEYQMAWVWWGYCVFVFGKMKIECVCVWQDVDKTRLQCFTEGPLVQSATFNGHHNINNTYIYSHVTHSSFINYQFGKRLLVLFSTKK